MGHSSFNIMFRDAMSDKELNKAEGFLFAVLNIAWIAGPLIGGYLLVRYGISSVFIGVSAFFFLAFVLLMLSKAKKKYHKKIHVNLISNFKEFVKNKKVRLPYLMTLGIEFWWSIIYVYSPLFLIQQGFKVGMIGVYFALIAVPLVLLEFKVGELSQKKGFKFFYSWGFGLLSIICIGLFFVKNSYWMMALFVLASIPLAFVEPLQDSFLFSRVSKKDEEKIYPIYATSKDVGAFLGKFIIAGVLLMLPMGYAFLVTAIVMVFLTKLSISIRK